MAILSLDHVVGRLLNFFDIGQGIFRFSCCSSKKNVMKKPYEEFNCEEKDFRMSLIPCLLPSREGTKFWVEPYLPYRFARQFGFDQGCPPMPPELPQSCREAGVGPAYWYTLWSRFQRVVPQFDTFFPGTTLYRSLITTLGGTAPKRGGYMKGSL